MRVLAEETNDTNNNKPPDDWIETKATIQMSTEFGANLIFAVILLTLNNNNPDGTPYYDALAVNLTMAAVITGLFAIPCSAAFYYNVGSFRQAYEERNFNPKTVFFFVSLLVFITYALCMGAFTLKTTMTALTPNCTAAFNQSSSSTAASQRFPVIAFAGFAYGVLWLLAGVRGIGAFICYGLNGF